MMVETCSNRWCIRLDSMLVDQDTTGRFGELGEFGSTSGEKGQRIRILRLTIKPGRCQCQVVI